jgi:hypothetical protein
VVPSLGANEPCDGGGIPRRRFLRLATTEAGLGKQCVVASGSAPGQLCESFDEGTGGVGDFAPAAVDGEGMSTVLDLDDLGDALVVLLLLVRGVCDSPR